jgi:hypothetical protein
LTAFIFHTALADQMQMIDFLKNMAMAGGFLLLAKTSAPGLGDRGLKAIRPADRSARIHRPSGARPGSSPRTAPEAGSTPRQACPSNTEAGPIWRTSCGAW